MRFVLIVLVLLFHQFPLTAQIKVDTLSVDKGEVMDILLLSQNPGTEKDFKSYLETVIPVGQRMSYQSLPSYKIISHTRGNLRPDLLILAKWNDIESREQFIDQIEKEIPDFHERRRKIWSYFGLRYYEIQDDLSFIIDRSKFHVATAYWIVSNNASNQYYNNWKDAIFLSNGEIILELNRGTSPYGYRYDPDYFIITSWENEKAFNAFQQKIKTLEMKNIQHVNEFILK